MRGGLPDPDSNGSPTAAKIGVLHPYSTGLCLPPVHGCLSMGLRKQSVPKYHLKKVISDPVHTGNFEASPGHFGVKQQTKTTKASFQQRTMNLVKLIQLKMFALSVQRPMKQKDCK